jgi:Flp pilus assembly protein TadD
MNDYAAGRMKEYAAGIQTDDLRLVDEPASRPKAPQAVAPIASPSGANSAGMPGAAPRSFAPPSGSASSAPEPAQAQVDRGGDEPSEAAAMTADKFLTAATKEYEAGIIDQPLWKHAVAQTGGDRTLAAQSYLRARATALRVQKREKRQERMARRVRAISELGNSPEGIPTVTPTAAPTAPTFARAAQPKGKQVMWIGGALASLFAVALFVTVRSESGAAPQHSDAKLPSNAAAAKKSADTKSAAIAKAVESDRHEDFAAKIEMLKAAGNWNVIVLHAGEWIRKEPDNPQAWRDLAMGYVRLGQYRDAIDAATRVTQLAPDDAAAWQSLGQIHIALQQPVDALAAFQEAVARNDQDASSLVQLGWINTQLGRFADARLAFNRAFAVNPQDVDALCGAASLATKEGRMKDAEAFTRQVASLDTRCRDANPGQTVRVAVGTGNRPASNAAR